MNKKGLKKNLIFALIIFVGILIFNTPIVKADSPVSYYISNNEAKNEREYWGYWTKGITESKPIKVKKGDTITVNVILNSGDFAHILRKGTSTVRWDAKAFELMPNSSGKYAGDFTVSDIKNVTVLEEESVSAHSDNYDGSMQNRILGSYSVSYKGTDRQIYEPNEADNTDAVIKEGVNKLYQLKFKVKEDISDGIYSIFTLSGVENMFYYDFADADNWDEGNVIYYQLGDTKKENNNDNIDNVSKNNSHEKENVSDSNTQQKDNNIVDSCDNDRLILYVLVGVVVVLLIIIIMLLVASRKHNKKNNSSLETINQNNQ